MRERMIVAVLAAVAALVFWASPSLALDAAYLDGSPVAGEPKAVAAAPGVSLGLVLTPPGEPPGAPLVLEISLEIGLARPSAPHAPAVRWQAAAYAGSPVRLTWEFAYPFEIQAGTWTMRVSQNGRELVSAAFEVTPAQEDSPGPAAKPDAAPGAPPSMTQAPPPSSPSGRKTPTTPPPMEPVQPPAATPGGKTSAAPPENGKPATAGHTGSESKPPVPSSHAAKPAAPEPGKTPPRAASIIGGDPARRVYAVLAGTYSEEARALWVAAFLKERGARACLRKKVKDGRTLYAVVAGWSDTREDAEKLRRVIDGVAPGSLAVPFAAGELEAGLSCR